MPVQSAIRHTFPAALGVLPLDALRVDGTLLVAAQSGLFAEDELAWAHDDGGQWRGPAPCRAVPSNLRIEGASSFTVGADEIQRVGADVAEVFAACELMEASGTTGGTIEFRVQNAITGADLKTVDSTAIPAFVSMGNLDEGCYLVLARMGGAGAQFRLPDGYNRSPLYQWGSGETDYWDYSVNVGRFPPSEHPFFEKRAELLDNNAQTDVPAWADYIIANSDDERGGEWSARGFVVGDGNWAPSASLIPLCGPSLFSVESVNSRTPIAVEPFARTGNVLKKSDAGELYLAGQRMTPSGLNACLWRRDNNSWILLGANENPSTGMCECALANHGPTSIVDSVDGRIYVLTKCSLHVYEASESRSNQRLPGVPLVTGGHPGGHSLVEVEGRKYFTSENFGQTDFSDERGQKRAQFYDFLSIQQGARRAQGPGTVFHGANDLTRFFGRLWGVMQDKAHSDNEARQFITWFDGGDWSFETSLIYPARFFRWQRLCGVEGLPNFDGREQQILLGWGKLAESEQGFIGVGDGREFTWEEWDYRIRRASVSPSASGAANSVLVVARACTAETIEGDWHIIEITAAQTRIIDPANPTEPPQLPLPPIPPVGEVAQRIAVRLTAHPNRPIHGVSMLDAGHGRMVERFNRQYRALRYRIDSDAAPDAIESYTFEAPYSRFEPLPRAAQTVDVLFDLPLASSDDWDGAEVAPVVVRRN